ncbi:MAG TPA: DUF1292 domain-containing protein [Jeotgalicoccus sp.]|jgi:uncharacterized protein YrzB (UPF0473 family)|nr:DUF1292 domain-containing protein [Jeotgalicoccus sp.]HBV22549.1 DUF1292 domain-containing protein [Jeotgalicoccus sp.]
MSEENTEFNKEEELLTLYDEDGSEVLYRKMLEFYHPDFDKNYVILAEEGNFSDDEEDIELIPMINVPDEDGDGGKFLPVETDDEWNMIEEVVNTQMDDDYDE